MFTLDNNANPSGSSQVGYINIAPAELIRVFGAPDPSDEYKTSGEYIFRGPQGIIFTLYDYKDTSLYSSGLQSPYQLWGSEEPYTFHIGSNSDFSVEKFKDWLRSKASK